jgi:hypothetical protein
VPARLLGLLADRHSTGLLGLIAVPAADPAFSGVDGARDLSVSQRAALLDLVLQRSAGQLAAADVAWSDAAEAAAVARAALRRHRLAQVGAASQDDPAGWATTAPARQRWLMAQATGHGAAEAALLRLPFRFQERAREALLPDERLLAVVHRGTPTRLGSRWGPRWPPSGVTGLLGWMRRGRLAEGLLLLTDRQLLLLTDALPPDRSLIDWGYVAQATAPERVVAVVAREADGLCWLEVRIGAAEGEERLRLPFPLGTRRALDVVAERLAAFQPRADERRPRQRPAFDPLPTDVAPGHLLDAEECERLAHRLAAAGPGDLLVRAAAPALPEAGAPARLVALASDALWIAEATGSVRSVPLAAVSSVALQHALGECWLRLHRPRAGRVETLDLPFPYAAADPFIELYHGVRRLLAGAAGGPEGHHG